jgi:hypothetical protein
MTDRTEEGSWVWDRCYACGHRLALASNGCPHCGQMFDGRTPPRRYPEQCGCERCTQARTVKARA